MMGAAVASGPIMAEAEAKTMADSFMILIDVLFFFLDYDYEALTHAHDAQ
jgi:hypothetical protein